MEIRPEDIQIDTVRVVIGPCAVRVTHLPTGVSVLVDDAEDVKTNRESALAELRRKLDE